jgi:hypothetical protein
MAYIHSRDLPIYFGDTLNEAAGSIPHPSTGCPVAATNVTYSYAPNISTLKMLGKSSQGTEDIHMAGPPSATLSFTCQLTGKQDNLGLSRGSFNPFNYTGGLSNTNGCSAHIGDFSNGITMSGLFLTSLSFNVQPYAPIDVSCTFTQYFTSQGQQTQFRISEESSHDHQEQLRDQLNPEDVAHGLYSEVDDIMIDVQDFNFESVAYSYSASYTPIYEIGSVNPKVQFVSAEQQLTVQADNITDLIPNTGFRSICRLRIKNANNNVLRNVFVTGSLNSENVQITPGDVARGSMTIISPLK